MDPIDPIHIAVSNQPYTNPDTVPVHPRVLAFGDHSLRPKVADVVFVVRWLGQHLLTPIAHTISESRITLPPSAMP
jgi:hypothetical protein